MGAKGWEGRARRSVLVSQVLLLLAEERTALAGVRTGLAVLALPVSVLTLLAATSPFYDLPAMVPVLVPLTVLCVGLAALGGRMVRSSLRAQHRIEARVETLRREDPVVEELIEEQEGVGDLGFPLAR